MSEICDLCRTDSLQPLYSASHSRDPTVYLCETCGLVQSLTRSAPRRRWRTAVPDAAAWGNPHTGKDVRAAPCVGRIRAHADLSRSLSILDLGSGRGAFARAILAVAPEAELVCVESDNRVAFCIAGLARLVETPVEDVRFEDARFDIVHCCRTITQLASPRATLAVHWRALKPGGLLVLDAPDLAAISAACGAEEWFVDEHLYYFSRATLRALLGACGFSIVQEPDASDPGNLLFVARKADGPRPVRANPSEVAVLRSLIGAYAIKRAARAPALRSPQSRRIPMFALKRASPLPERPK
jgi:SAM-dependent methyltransferase